MDLLNRGVSWQLGKLAECVSIAVTYARGAQSVALTVTRGRSEYQMYDDEGNLVTEVTDADFLFSADDLILGAAVVEPDRGDTITETTSGRVYVVTSSGNRRPFARDPSNQMMRVHTKYMKTV